MATIKGKGSNTPEGTGTQQAPEPKATQFKPACDRHQQAHEEFSECHGWPFAPLLPG